MSEGGDRESDAEAVLLAHARMSHERMVGFCQRMRETMVGPEYPLDEMSALIDKLGQAIEARDVNALKAAVEEMWQFSAAHHIGRNEFADPLLDLKQELDETVE